MWLISSENIVADLREVYTDEETLQSCSYSTVNKSQWSKLVEYTDLFELGLKNQSHAYIATN